MSGFITMDRAALDHPLLKNGDRFRAWFWIVSKACWKPTPYDINGKVVVLERGQLCVSRSQLAETWGWSPSAVERFLTRLETEQMIGRATGQGRTVITVCNYAKYQDLGSETGQQTGQKNGQRPDSDRTAKEQGNKGTIYLEPKGSCASSDAHALKPEHFVEEWNNLADRTGKPKVRKLTPERRAALRARINGYTIEEFQEVLGNIESSPFLRGDKGWTGCTFDWVTKKANFQKILEGNYNS